MKFNSQVHIRPKRGQKIRAWVLTSFLVLNLAFRMILRYVEISGTLGVFFKILTCGSKIFKNDPTFKMVKNHHFSTFDDFFFYFGQSGPSCLHLPNFASQKFLGAQGVPCQNLKNRKKSTSLK